MLQPMHSRISSSRPSSILFGKNGSAIDGRAAPIKSTGERIVTTIYTDLAVVDVAPDGLVAREIVDGLDLSELTRRTGAPIRLANDWRRIAAPTR